MRRQRYGPEGDAFLVHLRETEQLHAAGLVAYQERALQRVVRRAFETVPYYRRMAAEYQLRADDIQTIADLRKLPLLEKDTIRHNPEDFLPSDPASRRAIFRLHTSGTSGMPITVYCDYPSRRRHYAFWSRLRSWFGITRDMDRATFFGRIIASPDQTQPPFWRSDRAQRNTLFSSYHLAPQNLPAYYAELCKRSPVEIIGYPSSLFPLACYCNSKKLTGIRPKVVFTTAETLLSHQRAELMHAFEAPVVDQYGCTEMVLFASQCEQGSYHLHPEHGILEVIGPDGCPVPDGTTGEAVCTGLINDAMPLLRYRLGDRLAIADGLCSCGRAFPQLVQVAGRVDDVLVTPSGRPLGRLDPVFKPLSGIRETQIVQTHLDRLLLRLVADATFGERDREELLYELGKRVGEGMQIDLEFVPFIPKDANGKFRTVISELHRPAASGHRRDMSSRSS